MYKTLIFLSALCIFLAASSCGPKKGGDKPVTPGDTTSAPEKTYVTAPGFDADSAFAFVKKQVDFGPRIPNTAAHRKCGDWLVQKFASYADSVYVQEAKLVAWDNTYLDARNIHVFFGPQQGRRIMLSAHWDTRPFSDEDAATPKKTFDGADDGASGVAVLLEIARVLKETPLKNIGVDIVLFDAEDWGKSEVQNSYCLGSQYWARNFPGTYKPAFAVNLDMVGASGARFCREGYSVQHAAPYVSKVWGAASRVGYSAYFLNEDVPAVVDDHYYVYTMGGIPAIDIINYSRYNGSSGGFPEHWHTQNDNLAAIDRNTLKAVGTVVLDVLYNE